MRSVTAPTVAAALVLAACSSEQVPALPSDPVEQAAACGVIAAATEREHAGAKGDLSADAQARILHYAMLYALGDHGIDPERVNAVSKRMPGLFDSTIKGKWRTLRPACAAAFPATRISQPELPARPLDRQLICYALTDFLRKALSGQGATYAPAIGGYDILTGKLDMAMTPALRAAGIHNGVQLAARREQALAAAAKLGQPSGVMAACERRYG